MSRPTNYALTVAVFVGANRIDLDFTYDRSRFGEAQACQLRDRLRGVLERIAADADGCVGDLGRLDDTEIRQLLDWSGAALAAGRQSLRSNLTSFPQWRARLHGAPTLLRWCSATKRSAMAS